MRKRKSTFYINGIEGVADDFPGLTRRIEAQLHTHRYRRVVTLGTSAGGFFAIWAAVLIAAQRGISVGGFRPTNIGEPLVRAPADADFRIVFGEKSPMDFERALAIQKLFGGSLQPVTGVAEHNVFAALMNRAGLSSISKGFWLERFTRQKYTAVLTIAALEKHSERQSAAASSFGPRDDCYGDLPGARNLLRKLADASRSSRRRKR